MVNELIYALAMFVFAMSILLLGMGMVRPSMFRFLGSKVTRAHLVFFALSLLFLTTTVAAVFEPAEFKQARIDREDQSRAAQQNIPSKPEKQEVPDTMPLEDKTPLPKKESATPQTNHKHDPYDAKSVNFENDRIVKQARNKICLAPSTPSYNRTTSYKAFNTMDECLAADGRLHKD